jgi:predicted N-acyltransferase
VLIAFKDFTADYEDLLKPLLKKGFSRIEGLPSTAIDIDFADFDEYLKTLSGESRSDLRRKFKKVDKRVKIDMEVKNRLEDGPLLQVYNLYLATLNSHEFGFEVTPIDFFRNISINMPDQARFFLWRIDGKLVAFTFSLVSKDFFSDYYVGFDYSLAYKHHLYFVRFRDLMNWCIEHGIKRYDMGVTSYEPKKRLGFRPVPLYIYAVCRNRWFRPIFNILCRILAFENFDPALGEMKRKRYKDRNAE